MQNAAAKKTVLAPSQRILAWRPFTWVLLAGGFVLVLVALAASFMATQFKPTTEVRIGSSVYALWVADTQTELTKGLSGVEGLALNGGLLMEFSTDGLHGIWMKDMNIPLDIVWLDKNKVVVYMVKNAQPENPTATVYAPKVNARYVLELPAGSIVQSGIKNGTKAEFNIDV